MLISTSLRLRSKVSDRAITETLAGKILAPADYDVLITGPTRITRPDGKPLCVYLPGALADQAADPAVYAVLHFMHSYGTDNRGLASGSRRLLTASGKRSYALRVRSLIAGSYDMPPHRGGCRLTAWTGQNLPQWEALHPMLRTIADRMAEHVPDRYEAQLGEAKRAHPEWVVPGTPFTTITVNNSYSTGVHTDKGDLEAGFSTIACLRRGEYTGGQLVFPAYRVAVDMHDGDLLLMDAHDWHGNVAITCACGTRLNGPCKTCGAERISIVSYFRSKITECGTPEQEYEKATHQRERSATEPANP